MMVFRGVELPLALADARGRSLADIGDRIEACIV